MAEITIECGEDDLATRRLTRTLLVTQIALNVAVVALVLSQLDHSSFLEQKAQWYVDRLTKRVKSHFSTQRQYRLDLGKMLFEAQSVMRDAA
jgi:hypothetical protein